MVENHCVAAYAAGVDNGKLVTGCAAVVNA